MPNWENYAYIEFCAYAKWRELEKAPEWYKKRRKRIYVACLLCFVICFIALMFLCVYPELELILIIGAVFGLCGTVLLLLIAIAERWESEYA